MGQWHGSMDKSCRQNVLSACFEHACLKACSPAASAQLCQTFHLNPRTWRNLPDDIVSGITRTRGTLPEPHISRMIEPEAPDDFVPIPAGGTCQIVLPQPTPLEVMTLLIPSGSYITMPDS